jgi:hypothetical protein
MRIVNNLVKFAKSAIEAQDRALNKMAIDIERLSKEQVPHDKGQLKASGYHKKTGILEYRVGYNKEYARFQEFGGDGKRIVRRYSKPGKKKFYLRDPSKIITERGAEYFINESRRIRI